MKKRKRRRNKRKVINTDIEMRCDWVIANTRPLGRWFTHFFFFFFFFWIFIILVFADLSPRGVDTMVALLAGADAAW